MVDTIERCAAAIAEVREKYFIVGPTEDVCTNFVAAVKDDGKIYMPFRGTRAECQAWIDGEAARACVAALLPVSDEMLAGGMDSEIVYVPGTYQPEREATSWNIITAAITAVLEGKA